MARRQRFHLPDATYHVMLRGNDGQDIFFSDADRIFMCLLIQKGIERFGHSIHAFCFMSNHIHLAVQVSDISISSIMHHLAFRYAQYINRQQHRKGHLFQGRFKSILIDERRYLKELVRYIHLNAVRAKIVTSPEKYRWSSHRSYLNKEKVFWVSHERVLKCFNTDLKESFNDYERYILKGIGVETEVDFKSGCIDGILGEEEFVDNIVVRKTIYTKNNISLNDLIAKICERQNLTLEELRSPVKHQQRSYVRAILALLVRETDGLSLEKLSHFLNREPSGLSKLAARLENKCYKDAKVAKEIQEIRTHVFT